MRASHESLGKVFAMFPAPGSFEPVGSPRRTPNTSPTGSVNRRGAVVQPSYLFHSCDVLLRDPKSPYEKGVP
jgi:hypothetical protein